MQRLPGTNRFWSKVRTSVQSSAPAHKIPPRNQNGPCIRFLAEVDSRPSPSGILGRNRSDANRRTRRHPAREGLERGSQMVPSRGPPFAAATYRCRVRTADQRSTCAGQSQPVLRSRLWCRTCVSHCVRVPSSQPINTRTARELARHRNARRDGTLQQRSYCDEQQA